MKYEDKNYSGMQPAAQPGDVFTGCNLSQAAPHTQICADVPGLRFVGCNLTNCDLPDAAIVEGCNQAQNIITTDPETGLQTVETIE